MPREFAAPARSVRTDRMRTPASSKRPRKRDPDSSWDTAQCEAAIKQLWSLRAGMLASERAHARQIREVAVDSRASARNLAHYLALRQHDCRPLQDQLARIGVSSLGRSESNVLANLDKVLGILHRLVDKPWRPRSDEEPAGIVTSRALLDSHSSALLGPRPRERATRIMVTLPSSASSDFALVRELVSSGMDIARINCAHDDAAPWRAMAAHVRRAARTIGRPVKILMDLAGPKLRTGDVAQGVPVLKVRPERDELGRVVHPALLGLYPRGRPAGVPGASMAVGVNAVWLRHLRPGERIDLMDARGASRHLQVVRMHDHGVVVQTEKTLYLAPDTRLSFRRGKKVLASPVSGLPVRPGRLLLNHGQHVYVTRDASSKVIDKARRDMPVAATPTIPCTLPEVFTQVCPGERILFDDGRIGGIIRRVERDFLDVEIIQTRTAGDKLSSDKGINLPDSQLSLPALTDKDLVDLHVVAQVADMVGLSFVQRAGDIQRLYARLARLGKTDLGLVLKIETRRAFENLPELLFAAMAGHTAGIMIARGDLAVECGYERLAEVQEEILWAAEAAHLPVIWATEVLDTMARTGRPSRAEITDAAMGERAECVMLNKGPNIIDAVHALDEILRRMQTHQSKKRSLLRALKAWSA